MMTLRQRRGLRAVGYATALLVVSVPCLALGLIQWPNVAIGAAALALAFAVNWNRR